VIPYRIEYRPKALRELRKLPRHVHPLVVQAIEALASAPRPHGCRKLKGPGDFWRVRVGEYRVVYEIDDGIRVVTIQRAAHRREVYED
jgi:mRNA interferase RelE/StbE